MLLALLSSLEVLGSLLPISSETLWPVRMVAREISPWFVAMNLLGVVLAIRGLRAVLPLFVIGLAVAVWPIVQMSLVRADIMEQWRQQGFARPLVVPGAIDVLAQSVRVLTVAAIEPEVLSPTMHLYRSHEHGRDRLLPTIVDIHGGSWQVGGVLEDARFSRRMAAKGYAVFAIDYRKAPAYIFPAQRDDVRAAVAWIHGNASRLGADPERIALVGRSAGGHLAMLAAYQGVGTPIRAVVNIYGPADLVALHSVPPSPDPLHVQSKVEAFLGGSPAAVPDVYREASPVNHIRANMPPTLHIQGGRDNVVTPRFTRDVHAVLLANRSRSLLLELPWADHSFDFVYFGPSNVVAQAVLEAFLAELLRGAEGAGHAT